MELGTGINKTNVLHLNPCYKIVSSTQTETAYILCGLFDIFLGTLSAVTVGGNLLVIISVVYFKQLHTPTNGLILSLAVVDLLVGAVVFPLTMEFSISSCLYQDGLFCKVRSGFDISLSTCSVLNLCCIAIDRYYAVCQPLTYKSKISSRVIGVMILVSWGIPGVVAIGLVGFNRVKCGQKCFFVVLLGKVLLILITFYLPLIIMLCLYVKIFLVAQRQAHSVQSTAHSGPTVSRGERKATRTLAIVMGVFLICWLPSFLCTTMFSFSKFSETGLLVEIFNWLALSNSMLNPFIYAFFYSWFRSAFKMIISGKIIFHDFTNTKLL